MKISNEDKTLDVSISGYEFPGEKSDNEEYNYDANWLIVRVAYKDGAEEHIYQDSCLMTDELKELANELEAVLDRKEMLYISDFMEPYLRIAIVPTESSFIVAIQFVYDTTDGIWKSHKVSQALTPEQASSLLAELRELKQRYPVK